MINLETDALLGLAALENHPRLEAMRGLNSIMMTLTVPTRRKHIQRLLEIAYNNEAHSALLEGDEFWNALERFCAMLATDQRWSNRNELEFVHLPTEMGRLLEALETNARQHQSSSAAFGAFEALLWLRESVFGRTLNAAQRAVLRGLYERERNLR